MQSGTTTWRKSATLFSLHACLAGYIFCQCFYLFSYFFHIFNGRPLSKSISGTTGWIFTKISGLVQLCKGLTDPAFIWRSIKATSCTNSVMFGAVTPEKSVLIFVLFEKKQKWAYIHIADYLSIKNLFTLEYNKKVSWQRWNVGSVYKLS